MHSIHFIYSYMLGAEMENISQAQQTSSNQGFLVSQNFY